MRKNLASDLTPGQKRVFRLLHGLMAPDDHAFRLEIGPLGEAIYDGDVERARALLAGRPVEQDRVAGWSPLTAAASAGDLEMVELLLSHGARTEEEDAARSPLAAAARQGHTPILLRLLEASPSADHLERALLAASTAGHLDCVRILVEAGADPDYPGRQVPVAELAERAGHADVARYLRGGRSRDLVEAGGGSRLFSRLLAGLGRKISRIAAPSRDTRDRAARRVCRLIESGALTGRIDDADKSGDPAIVLAANGGRSDVVGCLLEGGADPDARGRSKTTALIEAARYGSLEVVSILLAHGADPRAKSDHELTAAAEARGPHRQEIRELIQTAARNKWAAEKDPGSSVRLVRAKRTKPVSEERGLMAFVKWQRRGEPDWAVGAVRAPCGQVAEAYRDIRGATRWQQDTRDQAVESCRDSEAPAFVAQLEGHDWSLVIRATQGVSRQDLEWMSPEGRALSQRLSTRAVSLTHESTGGTAVYAVHDRGELTERATWTSTGKLGELFSILEDRPVGFKPRWSFVDRLFASRGIFIPPCHIEDDGLRIRLVLKGVRRSEIERIDFMAAAAGNPGTTQDES